MDREHTMRVVDGHVVTCTCGYSVAFPNHVEESVAAMVARRHLQMVQAPLIQRVHEKEKTSAE
jgi:hypothetical protein